MAKNSNLHAAKAARLILLNMDIVRILKVRLFIVTVTTRNGAISGSFLKTDSTLLR